MGSLDTKLKPTSFKKKENLDNKDIIYSTTIDLRKFLKDKRYLEKYAFPKIKTKFRYNY